MSTSGATIGIVIAAYQAERWLDRALTSLKSQTHESWECVVIDDGSRDATRAVAERVAAVDPRLTVRSQANSGVSAARNTGLRLLSSGVASVLFLDSDDLLCDDGLRALWHALEARPDAVGAYGYAEYIDEDDRPLRVGLHGARQRDRRMLRGWRREELPEQADSTFASLVVGGSIYPTAVALLRRPVLDQVGGFDEDVRLQEDWELYLRMARLGPLAVVPQQVAWYRRHPGNLTARLDDSAYHHDAVRRKVWVSTANTPRQRREAARAWRFAQLARCRRDLRRVRAAGAHRDPGLLLAEVAALVLDSATTLRPWPPRPSRWRTRATRRRVDPSLDLDTEPEVAA